MGTTSVAAAGGTVGVRLANWRRYTPNATTDPELPAGESVFEASRSLSVLDHRAVTRVDILEDGTDRTPYRRARYRHEHQRSRHRYQFVYSTFAVPEGGPPPALGDIFALLHSSDAQNVHEDGALPTTTLLFASPRMIIYDPGAETPSSPDERPRVDDQRLIRRAPGISSVDERPQQNDFVLSADADWEPVDATDETVVYETAGRENYTKVVPVAFTAEAVADASHIRATLDRETGRLLELDDHRVVEQQVGDADETRTFTYNVVTEFDRYGEIAVERPGGPVPTPSWDERLAELWSDLLVY